MSRAAFLGIGLALCSLATARAETKITLLCVPAGNMVGAFVALDQGFFRTHGLDVTFLPAQNGSMIPAAIVGGSAQIGGPSPTVLLEADDQGLDLVVVASTIREPQRKGANGALARTGSGINGPADLLGRKVGLPGFGGIYDVVAKKWVEEHGIDYHKVDWVEVLFPQMADAMRAGLVDAVTAINPFYSRIIDSKIGYDIGDIDSVLPRGTVPIVLVATRAWASANADSVDAFRAALDDATAYIGDPAHRGSVRASIAKYTRLPPQAAATIDIPLNIDAHARPEGLKFWIEVSREQGLIKANPDPARLIAP